MSSGYPRVVLNRKTDLVYFYPTPEMRTRTILMGKKMLASINDCNDITKILEQLHFEMKVGEGDPNTTVWIQEKGIRPTTGEEFLAMLSLISIQRTGYIPR